MVTKSKSPANEAPNAGLSLASPRASSEDTLATKKQSSIASRALALSTYFLSGALCINLSQVLGTPLYLVNEDWYNAWIAFTKQSFGLLTMTLTQTFSPTQVIVSGDESVRGQILRKADGTLLLDFPERLVLIANHQIYTDWLYLWWTAYCSNMHGRLYIILKESLKRIPVLGWGMQFSQFIFLKRNWEKDRGHMSQALQRLNKPLEPMWLLLFPEGTNLAPSTRAKSTAWAKKNNIKDMRHTLLPRSTGLRFCIQELEKSVDYVYDCTIAYEGVPRGQFAQDIFTLKAGYLEGKPPKSVSMYWRRYAIKDIPIHNTKAFELWLLARWREKDLLIENYLIHAHFPKDTGVSKTPQGKTVRGCGHLNVDIRSSHWYEFLQIFAPMGILAMVLYIFYGALPQKMLKSTQGQVLQESAQDLQHLRKNVPAPSVPQKFDLDMIFDKDKQGQTFGNAGLALGQWLKSPEANRLVNNADTIYRWLDDPQKAILDSITGDPDKQNFLKSIQEEEAKRKKLANKHHGTFWTDIASAGGTQNASMTAQPSKKSKTGSFYKDLQEAQKRASSKPIPNTNKGTFWDDLKKEQILRGGTVVTLSDSTMSSTARTLGSAPTSATSKSTVPKTATTGTSSAKVAKTVPNKNTSPVKSAPVKPAAASSTQPKKPTNLKPLPASGKGAVKTPPSSTVTKKAPVAAPNKSSQSQVTKSPAKSQSTAPPKLATGTSKPLVAVKTKKPTPPKLNKVAKAK